MIISRILLFLSLFLTFAFSAIGLSVVINALVKSNNESAYVKSVGLADGAIVDVNYHDMYSVCTVMGAASALLIVLSLISTLSQFVSIGKKSRILRLQSYLILFSALWLLATVIACDVLFATRSIKITATIGGIAVPQSTIDQIEQSIGLSPEYKKTNYLRLCAILPWFAVLFAALSGLLLHRAASDVKNYVATEGTDTEKMARPSDARLSDARPSDGE